MIPKSTSSAAIGDGHRFSEKIMRMLREAKRGMRAPQPEPASRNSERAMKRFTIAAAAAGFALAAALTGANAQEKLKVGFIYVGPVGDMGWSYQHEVARRAIQEQFKDKIDTSFLENVNEGPDAERSIEQLVRTGHKLIYTTSFGFMDATAKVAKKYPNVMFEHATGYKRDKNLATYSGRFYEGRYIQGVIAAKMSKTGTIGYIGRATQRTFGLARISVGSGFFQLAIGGHL